jgi:hypothetical protein
MTLKMKGSDIMDPVMTAVYVVAGWAFAILVGIFLFWHVVIKGVFRMFFGK